MNALKTAVLAALISLPLPIPALAATVNVSGHVTADTVWTSNNVYVMTGWVTVEPGVTLTLQPGTVVKTSLLGMDVFGTLMAQGTAGAPIAFTSSRDDNRGGDTNGDGAASAPAPNDWVALNFHAGSRGRMSHAAVSYGGYYSTSELWSASNDVQLDHVIIEQSGSAGLAADHSSVPVTNSTIRDNRGPGLRYIGLDPALPLVVTNNVFTSAGANAGSLECDWQSAPLATFRGNSSSDGRCAFSMSGTSNGDILWDNGDDLPIYTNNLVVGASSTLTLEAGTVVKAWISNLYVDGTFIAAGTAEDPVALTSYRDDTRGGDTNADGSDSMPGPSNWSALQFRAGSHGRMSHASVSYGGYYIGGEILSASSDVQLDHVILELCGSTGLTADHASVAVTNSIIRNNGSYGLRYLGLDPGVPLTVTGNEFTSTGGGAGSLDLDGNPSPTSTFRGNRSSDGRCAFTMSGSAGGDIVWDNGSDLPMFTSNLTILAGSTLTLMPGSVVKALRSNIYVDGALMAEGTPDAPIAITSMQDDARGGDTNADGDASAPGPGDWSAVHFRAGSHGRMSHASISYGGYYSAWELWSASSDLRLDHVIIEQSGGAGLAADHSSVRVTSSTIRDNLGPGLRYMGLDPAVPLVVMDNVFTSVGANAGSLEFDGGSAPIATFQGNRSSDGKSTFTMSGTSNGDILWDNGDLLPMFTNNLVVAASTTLRLEAGSIVKAWLGNLYVDGTLIAAGTAEDPVAITSFRDDDRGGDSNADGSDSAPAPGNWSALHFRAGSQGRMSHASVSYGGYYTSCEVCSASSDVELDHVILEQGNSAGLLASHASVRVTNSTIRNNAGPGLRYVSLDPAVPLVVADNVFTSEGANGGSLEFDGTPAPTSTFRGNRSSDGKCAFATSGSADGDIVWDNGSDLPLFSNNLVVGASSTLTLEAGTVVKARLSNLYVDGTLIAAGTAEDPVALTSYSDDTRGGDTNADGSDSVPAPNNWSALHFRAGSHGRMSHASVSYGGYYAAGNVVSSSSDVVLDRVTIDHSGSDGISATESGMSARNGSITDNGYGVRNASAQRWLDARGNWWGDASGPYHPTKNPGGRGQPVSDMVIFFPWAAGPEGDLSQAVQALLFVEGPSTAEVGSTVDYAIHYATGGATLTDAVLVVSLPLTANPEEYEGGTYLQETGEVFWLLGDLPPLSEGTVPLRVTYMWGVPRHFPDALGGLLISRGMDTGAYTFDLDRYLSYTPIVAGAPTPMSEGDIQAELAAYPDFQELHALVLSRDFTLLGGEMRTVDGVPYTVLKFGNLALDSEAELLRSQADDASTLRTHGPTTLTVEDVTGALTLNLELGTATLSGDWDAARAGARAATRPSKGVAFRNCLIQEIGMWAIGKVCKGLGSAINGYKCAKGLLSGDPGDMGDCLAFIEKVEETVPGWGEIKSIHTCYWDTIIGGNVDKYACNGSLLKVEPPADSWLWSFWPGPGAKQAYTKYTCDPTTQMWTLPVTLYCPRGFVAQEGADDGEGRPCVPANDDVAFAYGIADRRVPSRTRRTEILTGGDPNAKYGPSGDIFAADTLDYSVKCENVGDGTARGVFITDTLSDLADESTLSLGGSGSYSSGSRMIFWEIGDLAPKGEAGSQAEVQFSVKPRVGIANGATITNQAVVHFPSVPEETPTNSIVNTVATLVATPQELEMTAGDSLPITLGGRSAAGLPLSSRVDTPPLHGDLTGTAPNVIYTPGSGFTGTERFLFVVSDGSSDSHAGEVAVTVKPNPGDAVPPVVSRTSPADGQAVQAMRAPSSTDDIGPVYPPAVDVIFSEVMDATTITADAMELRDAGGNLVDRTVACDPQTGICRITVRQPWSSGTYSATVQTDVKDLNGSSLAAPYVWSFTVLNAITCALSCEADVPSEVMGAPIQFVLGYAVDAGCTGVPVFHWAFGDGGEGDSQSPTHAYTRPGTFDWTASLRVGGEECTRTGRVTIPGCLCDEDVNCSGAVKVVDLIRVQRCVMGLASGAACARADTSHDGNVNDADTTEIKRALLGMDACEW